jgi:nitroreductase
MHQAELLQSLRWRYATKVFDPTRRIAPDDWATLEEALVLTPSSFGLQPWKFIVVTDQALKKELRAASWNQSQVEDCSHHVVFAARKNLGEAQIQEFLERIASVRGVTLESLEGYKGFMTGSLVNGPTAARINEWAARQAYIAMGNFMTCAAMMGIDTCPMEGIVPPEYDRILGLEDHASVMACAAGYRSPDDKYAALPKVRFAIDRMIDHR